jgi:subtilase family serine protease
LAAQPHAVGAGRTVRAQAQDLGATAPSDSISASLVLKVQHPDLLEAFVASTQDPGSFSYHRFLSVSQFVALFAPSSNDIATITRYLHSFGITVDEVYADHLIVKVTGPADAFDRAFAMDMHDYSQGGRRFHRARRGPAVPLLLRDLLFTVVGPSANAQFRPKNRRVSESVSSQFKAHAPVTPKTGVGATGIPGDYTVGDVANLYNINPIYAQHITGAGRTIGIATLANFIPDDAYTYWSFVGLSVDPNRITQVHVDGGGELSSDAGSGETSLDVEQSGGLAPGAKIIVYDAPNTDVGFIDLFYKAASDNKVDSLSVSWGEAEEFYAAALNDGTDFTPELVAFHQAFLEAAAQGISLFASSGDNGAYDINQAFNDPVNNVLTVDSPAADPAITAAGGTTTPLRLTLTNPPPNTPDLVVTTEGVWGWDYIQDYLVKYLNPAYQDALFPAGGGGGVSVYWQRPWYQAGTAGIRRSEAGQSIVFQGETLLALPAQFRGRNVPDVSLNADPFSGYIIISTEDGGLIDGFGGTSFVAPQLNGISALLAQQNGGRLGLWNPMLYRFKNLPGAHRPLVDITAGDNWFYNGIPGYEPGAGLGVLNVANFAAAIAHEGGPNH